MAKAESPRLSQAPGQATSAPTGESMPGPDDRDVPRAGLRRRVARGTIINGVFDVGLNVLALLKGFIAAALISTSDYGVWGLLFVSLGTLVWLKQVGIGDKYIQQSDTDQELAFQKAFTLELIVTGAFTVLLVFVAVPALTLITGKTTLLAPGAVLALTIPGVFLQTPLWIFYRRMDYVRQRTLQAADPVTAVVITIALAVAGAGYWSLVIGALAGSWIGAIVAIRASPYKLRLRYDRGTFREYRDFSWPLFVAAAASLVLPQVSVLVGERAVGLAGVGSLALAVNISTFTSRVDQIVTNTIYPAICAVRDRTDLLLESFVKSNRLALLWGVPFGVGVALFAQDLVSYGIGNRWQPAVGLIRAFGLFAAADQIAFNWGAFFRARAETKPIAIVNVVVMVVFLAAAVPLLLSDGLNGFAVGMAAVTVAGIAARTFFLTRLFPALTMARHAMRAITPTIPAAGAVLALRTVEGGGRSPGLAVLEVGIFAAVTVAATAWLERDLLRELVSYLRSKAVPGG